MNSGKYLVSTTVQPVPDRARKAEELLLKKIKEHKPYVHCTLENTVPENAVATREFMEKTYAEC